MKVPLLDLKRQYQEIKDECLRVTEAIYDSQQFILGPYVEALERDINDYCETEFAVGVSSGSDALLIALMAADIKAGDRVLTTPYTFFATAGSIRRLGAIPVFVDIEPDTYNMDPAFLEAVLGKMGAEAKKTLKAVIPVHLYGQCAEMDPILEISGAHRLMVVEDAAQAIGSVYKGRRAGAIGDMGCFSFFPTKNLGGFGDGGMVTTNSTDFYEKLKILRVHGGAPKYYHQMIGGNFRLDALQAAIVSIKLGYLDQWTRGRQENAKKYRALFSASGLEQMISLPVEKQDRHIYNQFVIRVPEKRDALRSWLNDCGIGNEIYYPVPLHLQTCFADLGYAAGDFPVSEKAAAETLALPIFAELKDEEIEYVVDRIKVFYS
ncbi:MAG: DegT/DnrJ/EryC1/StrS family aminotransferase [Desulfobacterales bacterium]|nr:DegT/DnrJ/EryC1/StrS family aminotransferase [Desulfobacterales bacterium]